MRQKRWAILALATVAALAVPASVPGAGAVKLVAELDGNEEVPDKGDPNGTGAGDFRVKVKKRKLCYDIAFERIEPPPAGHIHEGDEGVAGGIVITLFEDPAGATSPVVGCVKAKRGLLKEIKRSPAHYYANLHNAEYPGGAIRGQLTRVEGTA